MAPGGQFFMSPDRPDPPRTRFSLLAGRLHIVSSPSEAPGARKPFRLSAAAPPHVALPSARTRRDLHSHVEVKALVARSCRLVSVLNPPPTETPGSLASTCASPYMTAKIMSSAWQPPVPTTPAFMRVAA